MDVFNSLRIEYALSDAYHVWLMLYVRQEGKIYRSLVCLDAQEVSVSEGCIFLECEDVIPYLMRGYVLGTKFEIHQPKYPRYEIPRKKAK